MTDAGEKLSNQAKKVAAVFCWRINRGLGACYLRRKPLGPLRFGGMYAMSSDA